MIKSRLKSYDNSRKVMKIANIVRVQPRWRRQCFKSGEVKFESGGDTESMEVA